VDGRYLALRLGQIEASKSSLFDIDDQQLRRRIAALDAHLGSFRQEALNAVVNEAPSVWARCPRTVRPVSAEGNPCADEDHQDGRGGEGEG